MLLTKKLKFYRVIAFMPIYNQKIIYTIRLRLSILFKIPDPFYTLLIYSPAIISYKDNLIR